MGKGILVILATLVIFGLVRGAAEAPAEAPIAKARAVSAAP